MSEPVNKSRVGMTDLAWKIAEEEAAKSGCSSVSEYLEWITLSQRFSASKAASLLKMRRQRGGRGGRGGVTVAPDDYELPPEG